MVIGEIGHTIVAMGGLKRLDDSTGEMKRVSVDPENHGMGIGQTLLTALENRAKELGMKKSFLTQHIINLQPAASTKKTRIS